MTEPTPPWPESPDVYGYLSLDARGHWLIRGQPISRPSLVEHLQRHYQCDEAGRWFVKNGWQRAFVTLAYTPWILRVDGRGALFTHCGNPAAPLTGAFLDDSGALILETASGPGLVDDNDLDWALEHLRTTTGPLSDAALETALAAPSGSATALRFVQAEGAALAVRRLDRANAASHFGFVTHPRPLQPPSPRLQ